MFFSGLNWKVKDRWNGPGPNHFSPENVWVNSKGLHLKISQRNGIWYCASVSTDRLGYGRYIFYLSTRFDLFPENVVLGMFTYENDAREMDIELRRRDGYNGIFVIQGSGRHQFSAKLNGPHTTHRYKWEPNKVTFQSIHGHHRNPPKGRLITSWTQDKAIPKSRNERVHINLWLRRGQPSKETEVLIKGFEFIPL